MTEFFGIAAIVLGASLGLLVVVLLLIQGVAWLCEARFTHFNRDHKRYLKQLEQSGFHPSQTYIRFGYCAAVDPLARKILLASGSTRKLYDVADIKDIESQFVSDQASYALRFTLRDFSNPFFEIKSYFSNTELRAVNSLLALLREQKSTGDGTEANTRDAQ